MSEVITVNLKIWRQESPSKEGYFEEHAQKVTTEASFLEMIDLQTARRFAFDWMPERRSRT